MKKYTVRKTTSQDIENLIRIEHSAAQAFLKSNYAWIAKSPMMLEEIHLSLIANDYAYVVVNEFDQAVAFIYAKKYNNDFYILEFDVDLELQKQGIGRQLLEFVINIAQIENFDSVTLTTFVDVAWNKPFYEKLGFTSIDAQKLPDYLVKILEKEVNAGFPREKRCAMRFKLG